MKISFKKSLTISRILNASFLSAVFISTVLIAVSLFSTFYREKVQDIRSSLFTDSEIMTLRFEDIMSKKLTTKTNQANSDLNFSTVNGEFFVSLNKKNSEIFNLLPVIDEVSSQIKRKNSRFFLATIDGELLYSSKDSNNLKFRNKKIFAYIATNPFHQGMWEYIERDERLMGFAAQIAHTNLIVVNEFPVATLYLSILKDMRVTLFFSLGIIIFSILIIQIPIQQIVGPIQNLTKASELMVAGQIPRMKNFGGLGEISSLSQTFKSMVEGIEVRNRKIESLLEETVAKTRLESEINLARNIQANLLPSELPPKSLGVELNSFYKPAEEVAGDWFQYRWDLGRDEFTAVIADVSGHGAGASLFTAILSGLFEEENQTAKDEARSFAPHAFLYKANHVIRHIGKGNWHASCLVMTIVKDQVTIINAGHTPLIIMDSEDLKKTRIVSLPSTPLGIDHKISTKEKVMKFCRSDRIFLYTDGLNETRREDGELYGFKRLVAACQNNRNLRLSEMVDKIFEDVAFFGGNQKQGDDICVVAIQKSA